MSNIYGETFARELVFVPARHKWSKKRSLHEVNEYLRSLITQLERKIDSCKGLTVPSHTQPNEHTAALHLAMASLSSAHYG